MRSTPGILAAGMSFLLDASREDLSSFHQPLPPHGPGHGLLSQRNGGCLLVWHCRLILFTVFLGLQLTPVTFPTAACLLLI